MVPVSELTGRVAPAKITPDPGELPVGDAPWTRVHRNEMPGAEVEAVVPAVAPVSSWTEVVEVPVGCRRVIVVVARNRSRDALEAAPRRVVGSHEVGQLPVGVLVVPERERRCRVARKNEPSRLPLLCARLPCLRDVSRCRDHGIAAGGCGVEDLKRVGRGRESQQDKKSAHGILPRIETKPDNLYLCGWLWAQALSDRP